MATILVVDDAPESRVLLSQVLGDELGHALTFAPDGEAAIARYQRSRPELVITDVVMPKVDGVRLIKELMSRDPSARIIAVSGKGSDQLHRALAVGALAALPKPLQREALLAAIEKALEGPEPIEWGEEDQR